MIWINDVLIWFHYIDLYNGLCYQSLWLLIICAKRLCRSFPYSVQAVTFIPLSLLIYCFKIFYISLQTLAKIYLQSQDNSRFNSCVMKVCLLYSLFNKKKYALPLHTQWLSAYDYWELRITHVILCILLNFVNLNRSEYDVLYDTYCGTPLLILGI